MRGISDKNILDEFCISFCHVVEQFTPYIIVSGFVAISSGRTRATEDIDMIIPRITATEFKNLHEALQETFICVQSDSAEEIYNYLSDNVSVRYTYKNEPLPEMELKFAKNRLDEYQLQTRVKLPLTGLDIWFSSVEMNIAFKEEYLKSEKDYKDAEHLRKVYDINEEEIKRIKRMISEVLL